MKHFFDTSILIAAFIEDERCHKECAQAVSSTDEGLIYAHALSECFSILTSGRLTIQLSPRDASKLIEHNIFARMEIITLTAKEQMDTLTDCHRRGVRGGGIFDCLHITAARKAEADQILTLNLRHFLTFAPDLASKISSPL